MSMGYCGDFADVISEATLRKVPGVVEKLDALIEFLEEYNIELYEFADKFMYSEAVFPEYAVNDKITELYGDLCDTFAEQTGLAISVGYHDSENDGDKYDDLNGVYWEVLSAYTIRPEAKQFLEKYGHIRRAFFVKYG